MRFATFNVDNSATIYSMSTIDPKELSKLYPTAKSSQEIRVAQQIARDERNTQMLSHWKLKTFGIVIGLAIATIIYAHYFIPIILSTMFGIAIDALIGLFLFALYIGAISYIRDTIHRL